MFSGQWMIEKPPEWLLDIFWWGGIAGIIVLAVFAFFDLRKSSWHIKQEIANQHISIAENVTLAASTRKTNTQPMHDFGYSFQEALHKLPKRRISLGLRNMELLYETSLEIHSLEHPDFEYEAVKMDICEITIKNRSEFEINNVMLPIHVVCRDVILTENGMKASRTISSDKEILINLWNLTIEPQEEFIIWIENHGLSFLAFEFLDHILGQIDSSGHVRIQLISKDIQLMSNHLSPMELLENQNGKR